MQFEDIKSVFKHGDSEIFLHTKSCANPIAEGVKNDCRGQNIRPTLTLT